MTSIRSRDSSGAELFICACPRCGLTVPLRARWLAPEHCPRCVAHDQLLVALRHDSAGCTGREDVSG